MRPKLSELDSPSRRASFLASAIDILELTVCAHNALCEVATGAPSTVSWLIRTTARELLRRRNFGRARLSEVNFVLSRYELQLGMTTRQVELWLNAKPVEGAADVRPDREQRTFEVAMEMFLDYFKDHDEDRARTIAYAVENMLPAEWAAADPSERGQMMTRHVARTAWRNARIFMDAQLKAEAISVEEELGRR